MRQPVRLPRFVHPSTSVGQNYRRASRERASLGALDVTEWFGETSGGIRTYLLQKGLYVAARPWLRHVPARAGLRSNSRLVGRFKLAWPLAVAFASVIYHLVACVRGAARGAEVFLHAAVRDAGFSSVRMLLEFDCLRARCTCQRRPYGGVAELQHARAFLR